MSTVEQRRYTEEFVEHINQYCSLEFLNLLRKTRRFLYISSNDYDSIIPQWKQSINTYFVNKFNICLPDNIVIKNSSDVALFDDSIELFPSFSTSKRIIPILAFPKGDYTFCWSPIITSLNLVLRERSYCFNAILNNPTLFNKDEILHEAFTKLMDSFLYTDTNLRLALHTGSEIHFSTPPNQWLFCYNDEIDIKLLKKLFKQS